MVVLIFASYTVCQQRCKETETTCNLTTITKQVPQFDGFLDGPYINRTIRIVAPTVDFMKRPTNMTFAIWHVSPDR
jgi:hypothetical protein